MPDSFQNPVGGNKPTDPYGEYRAEEIQKDKHEKEQPGPPPEKPFLAAFILHALKKFFELFEKSGNAKTFSYSTADLRTHLKEMRELFEALKTEDHSQDVAFLQNLSGLWFSLHDDAMQFSRRSVFAIQMHALVQSIHGYPEGAEHSLGYYLSEYAGQKWMPFPCMEILQGLWVDYQKNFEASRLSEWCRDLDEMINSLGSD